MKWNNRQSILESLKMARTYSGLTQKQVAQKMGTKQPSIARAESGDIDFSLSFAERFARACGYELRFNHVSIESLDGLRSNSVFTLPIAPKGGE